MIEIINEDLIEKYLEILEKRSKQGNLEYERIVSSILEDIKINKDDALIKYTNKFDDPNLKIEDIKIDLSYLKEAYDSLDDNMKSILLETKKRIEDYNILQKRKTQIYEKNGETLGWKVSPLKRVGVYVPGGKASYPSSVLMNVIPARVAGVKEIVMTTPKTKDGFNNLVLAAAYVAGVTEVYTVGGAQAIGALAYGTQTIKRVDKIVGPGNIFVALAKKQVFGSVGIDSVAGPSEILILADNTACPKFLAADLMAQAEHDQMASSTLLTTDINIALNTLEEIKKYFKESPRKDILDKSLTNYSKIVVCKSLDNMIYYANQIAPEHLEICIKDPFSIVDKIENAGAMFLGNYTPEALGDYMAGPNHVLPTVKTSRFFSPLSVDDFLKKSSIISFTKEALDRLNDKIVRFAKEEKLYMHAKSVEVRK